MGGDPDSAAINRKGKKEERKTPSFSSSNKLLEMAEVAMKFKPEIAS